MRFKDIEGNEQVKKQLANAVKTNRIPHAQMFCGPKGSAKLALALAYTQYLFCENVSSNLLGDVAEDSCGQCASCQKVAKLIHPDVHFSYPIYASKERHKYVSTDYILDWRKALNSNVYMNSLEWQEQMGADSKKLNIPALECREIRKKLSLKAFEGKKKVLIMWLPEYLNKMGNILLKLIEEPPADTVIILVAENLDEILTTIKSRVQQIIVKRFTNANIEHHLIKLGCDEAKALNIAKGCDGNLNVALRLMGEENNDYEQLLVTWLDACLDKNITGLVNFSQKIAAASIGREGRKSFITYVLHFVRLVMTMRNNEGDVLSKNELTLLNRMQLNLQIEQYEQVNELLNDAHYSIERNANAKLLFLNLGIQLSNVLNNQTANARKLSGAVSK